MSSANTLEIKGKRSEIGNIIISSKGNSIENVSLLAKPSKKIFFLILNAFPNLKKITVGKGLARQVSKRQIEALEKTGIAVEMEKKRRGRKNKYTGQERKEIIREFRKDKSSVSKYRVTERTVYNWMKKQ
ncbi:MAG: hypothetical protein NTY68_01350 [Candidatus Micrarchaeota archaeon]|nr:hypothetical protein [Candidatus Micrarchaeota archaeon]